MVNQFHSSIACHSVQIVLSVLCVGHAASDVVIHSLGVCKLHEVENRVFNQLLDACYINFLTGQRVTEHGAQDFDILVSAGQCIIYTYCNTCGVVLQIRPVVTVYLFPA